MVNNHQLEILVVIYLYWQMWLRCVINH